MLWSYCATAQRSHRANVLRSVAKGPRGCGATVLWSYYMLWHKQSYRADVLRRRLHKGVWPYACAYRHLPYRDKKKPRYVPNHDIYVSFTPLEAMIAFNYEFVCGRWLPDVECCVPLTRPLCTSSQIERYAPADATGPWGCDRLRGQQRQQRQKSSRCCPFCAMTSELTRG